MTNKTKPSPLAIALTNAPALLNWYKLFKDLTEQFVASEIGGQLLIAAALHIHPIYTWDIWSMCGGQVISDTTIGSCVAIFRS